ncbi:hypothetical protein EVAR_2384_1 [Eumeta japonica]|uniref:Uncharacterized protein n=1 Tax=Eumeta variegata TaxID=151549 RepID=A0A4C2AHP3_EUMVA|nr:hypothetical protein EVAR_2384_1 [Eumeta japonica]
MPRHRDECCGDAAVGDEAATSTDLSSTPTTGREIDTSQPERLGRLSIVCPALASHARLRQNFAGCTLPLSLLLRRIGRWSGRDRCITSRTLKPIVPLYCSALSLVRSTQAERDNESYFSSPSWHQLTSITMGQPSPNSTISEGTRPVARRHG